MKHALTLAILIALNASGRGAEKPSSGHRPRLRTPSRNPN